VGTALSPETRLHIEKAVDVLVEEFGDHHTRQTVSGSWTTPFISSLRRAEVEDFLPALAHRFTRERLNALSHAHGPDSAAPDVLFAGLEDTGPGQMAAALLTLRSEGRLGSPIRPAAALVST
jgi:hypothetical protein